MASPDITSAAEVRGALEHCFDTYEALCADLSDDEWQTQSLCPDWTVRGVVDHVTSIEAAMAGWLPDDTTTPPPFERAGEFLADSSPYLDKVRAVFDARRRDLAALTDDDFRRPRAVPSAAPDDYRPPATRAAAQRTRCPISVPGLPPTAATWRERAACGARPA